MSLREVQFHLSNPALAAAYETIFADLIVGRDGATTIDTGEFDHQIYSYDKRIKNTIVSVFIVRVELPRENAEPEVEVLGFCYPRELEEKIINVSVSKDYDTVFKVPNGIEDLKTTEITGLRRHHPDFGMWFSRLFENQTYYILNKYDIHADPKVSFAEQPPLTPEQQAEAEAYDKFVLHDLRKFDKSQQTLFKSIGIALERVTAQFPHFNICRKKYTGPVTLVSSPAHAQFDAKDYEQRLATHDLYFTFVGDKVETLEDTADVLKVAFVKVPYYIDEPTPQIFDPIRIGTDDIGDNTKLELDEDLWPRVEKMNSAVDYANELFHNFAKKWSYHPELVERTINLGNLLIVQATTKQDPLYSFNDVTLIEAHLNKILICVDEIKAKLIETNPEVELGLDPTSWKLWDYSDIANPVEIKEWYLEEELGNHYSDSYMNLFSGYCRSAPHPLLRVYQVITPVAEEDIAAHPIGSVRQIKH